MEIEYTFKVKGDRTTYSVTGPKSVALAKKFLVNRGTFHNKHPKYADIKLLYKVDTKANKYIGRGRFEQEVK